MHADGAPGSRDAYIPPLDGLRCLAVLIVIWQHSNPLVEFGNEGVGVYGVWLFFVLSGFLITGILLRERDRVRSGMMTLGVGLRTFYVRRFLRLFPAYYLLLFVLAITGLVPGFRQDFVWYVTYMSNWLMAARGSFPGGTGHLWSLAVEEQFYLVWPLLILLAPARRLPWLFIGAILIALMSRAVIQMFSGIGVMAPTFSNFDSLALGALLAWHEHQQPGRIAVRRRFLRLALYAGCLLIFATFCLSVVAQRGWRVLNVTEALGASLVSVWLVSSAASQSSAVGTKLLSLAPIVYLGKISYGLYLYHHVLIYAFRRYEGLSWVVDAIGSSEGFGFFVVITLASVATASLSWYAFERPINRLKRFFPYA